MKQHEHSIQVQIAHALRLEIGPPGRLSRFGVIWFSVDIANSADRFPGARTARGIVAGLPDTWVLYRGRTHLIEIKTPDGILSESQQFVLAAARLAGCPIAVVTDAQTTLDALDEWAVPRKRRMTLPLKEER